MSHKSNSEIYTLSLHDALPISIGVDDEAVRNVLRPHSYLDQITQMNFQVRWLECVPAGGHLELVVRCVLRRDRDRKSTRLNSSHLVISYAVFCLKKKKHEQFPI